MLPGYMSGTAAELRATIHMLQHKLNHAGDDLARARNNEIEAEARVDALVRELGAAEDALKVMEQ